MAIRYVIRALGFAAALFLPASEASALCEARKEEGRWVNENSQTRSLPGIVVRQNCQDQVFNGDPGPAGPPYDVWAWGRCSFNGRPVGTCKWGRTGAKRIKVGDNRGSLYAVFRRNLRLETHSAVATVKVHMYIRIASTNPDRLEVFTWTDFPDARADYGVWEYFEREQ